MIPRVIADALILLTFFKKPKTENIDFACWEALKTKKKYKNNPQKSWK